MEFQKSDLLTIEQITSFLKNDLSPITQAEIVAVGLKKYVIVSNNRLYIIQKNLTYKMSEDKLSSSATSNELINIVSKYLELSTRLYDFETLNNLHLIYKKPFEKLRTNAGINRFIPQLEAQLTDNNINFDSYTGQIHFNNGFIDVKTGKFKKRKQGTHYITECLNRDYEQSTKEDQDKILKMVRKIVPNDDDLESLLMLFGGTLSGSITKEQGAMFFIGTGSRGKSTFLILTQEALNIYCVELKSDTFTGSETNSNKILNTYSNKPHLLFSFINEFDDKRMNTSIFKTFCEGKIATVKLFKEGNHNFIHKTLCVASMNEIPNFKVDTGVSRRLNAYEFTSLFVDNKKDVDKSKHIYLKDKSFTDTIKPLLNAWVDILISYGSRYMNGEKIKLTERFEIAKQSIVASNDIFQDFIDTKLTLTNNTEDRIGKEQMRALFLEMYPERHISVNQIISSMKDKSIKYEPTLRNNGPRGVFTGIKIKSNFDCNKRIDFEEDNDPLMQGVEDIQPIKQDNQIELLQKEINELKKLLLEKDEIIKQLQAPKDTGELKIHRMAKSSTGKALELCCDQTQQPTKKPFSKRIIFPTIQTQEVKAEEVITEEANKEQFDKFACLYW